MTLPTQHRLLVVLAGLLLLLDTIVLGHFLAGQDHKHEDGAVVLINSLDEEIRKEAFHGNFGDRISKPEAERRMSEPEGESFGTLPDDDTVGFGLEVEGSGSFGVDEEEKKLITDKTDDVRIILSDDGSPGDVDVGNRQMFGSDTALVPVYVNNYGKQDHTPALVNNNNIYGKQDHTPALVNNNNYGNYGNQDNLPAQINSRQHQNQIDPLAEIDQKIPFDPSFGWAGSFKYDKNEERGFLNDFHDDTDQGFTENLFGQNNQGHGSDRFSGGAQGYSGPQGYNTQSQQPGYPESPAGYPSPQEGHPNQQLPLGYIENMYNEPHDKQSQDNNNNNNYLQPEPEYVRVGYAGATELDGGHGFHIPRSGYRPRPPLGFAGGPHSLREPHSLGGLRDPDGFGALALKFSPRLPLPPVSNYAENSHQNERLSQQKDSDIFSYTNTQPTYANDFQPNSPDNGGYPSNGSPQDNGGYLPNGGYPPNGGFSPSGGPGGYGGNGGGAGQSGVSGLGFEDVHGIEIAAEAAVEQQINEDPRYTDYGFEDDSKSDPLSYGFDSKPDPSNYGSEPQSYGYNEGRYGPQASQEDYSSGSGSSSIYNGDKPQGYDGLFGGQPAPVDEYTVQFNDDSNKLNQNDISGPGFDQPPADTGVLFAGQDKPQVDGRPEFDDYEYDRYNTLHYEYDYEGGEGGRPQAYREGSPDYGEEQHGPQGYADEQQGHEGYGDGNQGYGEEQYSPQAYGEEQGSQGYEQNGPQSYGEEQNHPQVYGEELNGSQGFGEEQRGPQDYGQVQYGPQGYSAGQPGSPDYRDEYDQYSNNNDHYNNNNDRQGGGQPFRLGDQGYPYHAPAYGQGEGGKQGGYGGDGRSSGIQPSGLGALTEDIFAEKKAPKPQTYNGF